MPTYSVFTPLDPDRDSCKDLADGFLAMRFREAGTLAIDGDLAAHVRPGNLYIEHRSGTVYAGATMTLTMSFGGPAIGTVFDYPVATVGDLFTLTGYDPLAAIEDGPDTACVKIYAMNLDLVERALRNATDGRVRTSRQALGEGPVQFDLTKTELVRFVLTLYGSACAHRAEVGAPNHDRIPLCDFYAAIVRTHR